MTNFEARRAADNATAARNAARAQFQRTGAPADFAAAQAAEAAFQNAVRACRARGMVGFNVVQRAA